MVFVVVLAHYYIDHVSFSKTLRGLQSPNWEVYIGYFTSFPCFLKAPNNDSPSFPLVPIFAFSAATFTGSEAAQSVSGQVNIINNFSHTSPIIINIFIFAAASGSALTSKLLLLSLLLLLLMLLLVVLSL